MADHAYGKLNAQNYDAVSHIRAPSGDADFYLGLARETGGPVLELGCGTGRLLLPIAREGIECVGVDASAEMLAVFRAKQPPDNLALLEGRMEEFDVGAGRFRLVTAPYGALCNLLDVEAQLACLASIRTHLAPDGLLALDVVDPKLDRIAAVEEPEHVAVSFQNHGYEMRRWDSIRRDHGRQIMTIDFRFEGGPPELTGSATLQWRWFYRYELEHLLARAGFSNLRFLGGFDRRPWQAGGETIVLARRAE